MGLCILAGGKITALAISAFTLSWTHSVQKTEWRENWAITPAGLQLGEAAVKGSGSGMEPGPNAVLKNGWWVWRPSLPPQSQISLAASGMTASAWKLCHDGGCIELGAKAAEPVILQACDR